MMVIIILILVIIGVVYYFYIKRKEYFTNNDNNQIMNQDLIIADLKDEIANLKIDRDRLTQLKYADDNIFTFLKCHNQPTKNVCKTMKDGSSICRSRLINCDNFRLVLEDDPLTAKRLAEVDNL